MIVRRGVPEGCRAPGLARAEWPGVFRTNELRTTEFEFLENQFILQTFFSLAEIGFQFNQHVYTV